MSLLNVLFQGTASTTTPTKTTVKLTDSAPLYNSRKPLAAEGCLKKKHVFVPSEAQKENISIVSPYHGQDDESRNCPHGHVSQQVHQFVPGGLKERKKKNE